MIILQLKTPLCVYIDYHVLGTPFEGGRDRQAGRQDSSRRGVISAAAEFPLQLEEKQNKQTKNNPCVPQHRVYLAACCQRENQGFQGEREMRTVIRHSASAIKVVLACCFDLSAGHYLAYFSDVVSSEKHYLHGSCIVVLLRGRVAVRKYKAG